MLLNKLIHLFDDVRKLSVQSLVGFPLANINGDDFFRDEGRNMPVSFRWNEFLFDNAISCTSRRKTDPRKPGKGHSRPSVLANAFDPPCHKRIVSID